MRLCLKKGVGRPELLHCRVVVVRVRARPDWNGLLGCAVSFSRDEQRSVGTNYTHPSSSLFPKMKRAVSSHPE